MAEVAAQALIGPRKYIQGRGVLRSLGEHVDDLGKDAFIIADQNVWGLVGSTLEESLQGAEVHLIKEVFGGSARTGRSTGASSAWCRRCRWSAAGSTRSG